MKTFHEMYLGQLSRVAEEVRKAEREEKAREQVFLEKVKVCRDFIESLFCNYNALIEPRGCYGDVIHFDIIQSGYVPISVRVCCHDNVHLVPFERKNDVYSVWGDPDYYCDLEEAVYVAKERYTGFYKSYGQGRKVLGKPKDSGSNPFQDLS